MPKVSVVMPSLNVVNYIRETMESVLGQTLQDIEILCVDAGSTDGTWEVLEEYERKDSRIRLFKSEKKSYGYQMNLGICQARSEYIGIVETDDWIEPNMFQELYEAAVKHDACVVKSDFDFFTTNPDGTTLAITYLLKQHDRIQYNEVYSCEEYISGKFKVECHIWNAIYKKSFLEECQIKFNESPGAAYQDFGFKFQVAFQAEKIVAVNRSFYRYRRDNSGSSVYSPRALEFNLEEAKFLLSRFKDRNSGKKVFSAAARVIAEYALIPSPELLRQGPLTLGAIKALEEYQVLLKGFVENGVLREEELSPAQWLQINLLMENVSLYVGYTSVSSRVENQRIRKFFDRIREYHELVIFGSGMRGVAAYVFMRNNGMDSTTVFCDNDSGKWGTEKKGIPILSPAEAVKKYPNAFFVLSSPRFADSMKKQLESEGVPEKNICIYEYTVHPSACTNCMMNKGFS